MATKIRYLRNRKDGFIYEWDPILAANILCEEVTEEEAYPERFIPKAQKGRKAQVDLTTDDVPEEPELDFTDPKAQKGLPK